MGISTAIALASAGRSVVLLESGGAWFDRPITHHLADGVVEGDARFGGISPRVARGLGGTSWRWGIDLAGAGVGVRYAGMERGVLDRRPAGEPAWPITFDELRPWYDAALEACGVPASANVLDQAPSHVPGGLDVSRYVFGRADRFQLPTLGARLADLPITVLTRATLTGVLPEGHGRVGAVRVANTDGYRGLVEAGAFVLAMGTVETTRALLLAQEHLPSLADNRRIGANLMDRPRLYGQLHLHDHPPEWFGDFALHVDDGVLTMTRLTTDRLELELGATSASLLLVPEYRSRLGAQGEQRVRDLFSATLPSAWSKVAGRLPERAGGAFAAVERRTYPARSAVVRRTTRATYDTEWSHWVDDRRWREHRSWRVTAIVEQRAEPDNTISLTDEVDQLGMRTPRLRWGTPAAMTNALRATTSRVTKAFEGAGLGRLAWGGLAAVSSCHMMGTVAMGVDPDLSAADPSGLVRGVDNVYAAGASTTPQSGSANPTLTGIALALRLAAHIAGVL